MFNLISLEAVIPLIYALFNLFIDSLSHRSFTKAKSLTNKNFALIFLIGSRHALTKYLRKFSLTRDPDSLIIFIKFYRNGFEKFSRVSKLSYKFLSTDALILVVNLIIT